MSEVKNIPRLRFESFDRSYSEVRLSSLLKRYSQKNSDEEFKIDDILSLSSTHGIVDRKELLDNTYENVNHFAYVKTRVNDFVYGKSITKENPYGLFRANLLRDGLLSTLYFTFKVSDSVIPKFLEYYFGHTNRANNYLKKFVLVGDRYLNADANYILSGKISIPSLPEQQKIADFLTAVDKRIELLEKKKTLLETYKKGVMKKIFPSTSSGKNPEIRFKDDNGNDFPDWEEKRLGEIMEEFIVPMRDKPKKLDGEIPWCRIEDFNGIYLTESKSNQGVTIETVKEMNLKIFPINTILVSCSANLGVCSIVKFPLITNQTFIGLVPKNEISPEFIYYIMNLSARRLNSLSSGTTISYLSRREFENFRIRIPLLREQIKVSNFLLNIDTQVRLLQSKIDKSKTWKKGLLQKMFV